MKNTKLLVIGSIIASSILVGSAFAANPTYSGHTGSNKTKQHKEWSSSGTLAQRGMFMANITRTVTNISSGIQITETTSDATTLSRLNATFTKQQSITPKNANPLITITRAQISNGIQTTMTSTDAATVTKLQSNGGKIGGNGYFGRAHSEIPTKKASFKTNVTRTVTNISNGVQITETTSDATTLARLNAMLTKEQSETPKKINPLITTTRVSLTNGIQTTITSTNAATVAKLQANGGNVGKASVGKASVGKASVGKASVGKASVGKHARKSVKK